MYADENPNTSSLRPLTELERAADEVRVAAMNAAHSETECEQLSQLLSAARVRNVSARSRDRAAKNALVDLAARGS